MEFTLNIHKLQILLELSAKMGAMIAFTESGHIRGFLKKSEAYKRYGRKNVDKWIREGLITPRKDGDFSAAWRIDLLEIESIKSSTELLILFLNLDSSTR